MTPAIPTMPSTGTTARTGFITAANLKRADNSAPVRKHIPVTVANDQTIPIPYQDDRYFIISIYPIAMKYQLRQGDIRNGGRGVTVYEMPAAKRGEYQILEIAPTIAWRENFEDGYDQAPHGRVPTITSARQNAEALVALWTSGVRIGSGSPGIAMLPYGVLEGSYEFNEFVAGLIMKQELYFTAIVEDAQAAFMRGDKIQALDQAVAAAFWLSGENAKQYDWVGRKTFSVTKPCPACTNPINIAAIKCTQCNVDLLEFYQKYNASAEGADNVVYLYQLMLKNERFPSPVMLNRVLEGADPDVVVMEELESVVTSSKTTKKPTGK